MTTPKTSDRAPDPEDASPLGTRSPRWRAGLEIGRGWLFDGAVRHADTRSEDVLAVGYRF